MERVLAGMSESSAAQHAMQTISKMGYRSDRSSSSSESNRSNIRRTVVPKFGPSRNIDAHSRGMGINLVTAPPTLTGIAGSTTKVLFWSFPLALELYQSWVSMRRAAGKSNRWNKVPSSSSNTTTLGEGPCARMSPANATILLTMGSVGRISWSIRCT